ncbi:MAG: NAD+ synthase, partial [Burkholderiaceae bacterium]|nr:NAD+ synthase [Burkholderiaceae bacterium]
MSLQVLVAQVNATVGDVTGNSDKIKAAARRAVASSASVLLTPELSLVGYPPEDLILRPAFLRRSQEVLDELVETSKSWPGLAVIVGHPRVHNGHVFNAATVFRDGVVLGVYGKLELPNYAVFDEQRYFQADGAPLVFEAQGVRFGVNICEDIWFPRGPAMAKAEGAQVLLVLNASPFHLQKDIERQDVVRRHINDKGLAAVMCNLVGGQDELIFDGDSFASNPDGGLAARARRFVEDDLLLSISAEGLIEPGLIAADLSPDAQAYEALVLGTRDYVHKNGFKGGIIGLSGGIDSALTLAIAVDALGADQITAVMMPSAYTAPMSLEDAKACAGALGVSLQEIPISSAYAA